MEIADRKDHPTADRVFDAVKDQIPGVSRTTVYRVLELLVRLGIVNKIYQPGAAARFDPTTHPHHHFACSHCNKLIDVEDRSLSAIALPDISHLGFDVDESHVYFRGTCASCRAKLAEPRRSRVRPAERRRSKSTRRKTKATPARTRKRES